MGKIVFIKSATETASVDSSSFSHAEYYSTGVITLYFNVYRAGSQTTLDVRLNVIEGLEQEAIRDLVLRFNKFAYLMFSDIDLRSTQKTNRNESKTEAASHDSNYVLSINSIVYGGALPPQDINTLRITVRNTSGGTLLKGTPVHAVGVTGETADVIAARADTASAMPATYVLDEELENNAEGQAIIVGVIEGVDTSSFSPGDVVYVGATGGFTNVKPTGTNLIQNLGVVTKSNANTGSGVVYGSGRSNDVPNIPDGQAWIGNASGVATPTTLADVATSGAYADLSGTPSIPVSGVDFDPVGTDNSTDVTLTGAYNYLTLLGQQITLGQVDYTTDISNTPTIPTSGVDFDPVGTDNSTDASINANATDVLRMNPGQILGSQDAGADKLVFWDDSESKLTFATIGTNLTMTADTLSASGGGSGTITALNNQAENRLTTIGATTTELDGEANLTFDGTTLTVAGEMKAEQVYVNVRFTGTPSNGAFLDGARIGRGFFTTGSITAGSVYYLGASAWTLADADAASTGSGLLAVATDAGSAAEVLLEGAVKLNANTGYSGASKGDVLYLSLTAGEVTNDISSYTTGDIVRVLGYVLDATNGYIYFNPDNTWLEI